MCCVMMWLIEVRRTKTTLEQQLAVNIPQVASPSGLHRRAYQFGAGNPGCKHRSWAMQRWWAVFRPGSWVWTLGILCVGVGVCVFVCFCVLIAELRISAICCRDNFSEML